MMPGIVTRNMPCRVAPQLAPSRRRLRTDRLQPGAADVGSAFYSAPLQFGAVTAPYGQPNSGGWSGVDVPGPGALN